MLSFLAFVAFLILIEYLGNRKNTYSDNLKPHRDYRSPQEEATAESITAFINSLLAQTIPDTNPMDSSGDMYMSADAKRDYLQSIKWYNLRKQVIARDKHCQCCGRAGTQVHHITYVNLGNEPLSDLVFLCGDCHQKIHDIAGYDRTASYPINLLD